MGIFRFTDRWQTSLGLLLRNLTSKDEAASLDSFLALSEKRDRDLETFLAAAGGSIYETCVYAIPVLSILSGATQVLDFDTTIYNTAPLIKSGASLLTVRQDGGGLYQFEVEAYWATNADVSLSICVAAAGGSPVAIGTVRTTLDRAQCSAIALLVAGDNITVRLTNNSGGTITPTAYAGGATTPVLPYFKCYRTTGY